MIYPNDARQAGSIPACAGETDLTRGYRHLVGVYPRLCGGNGISVADRPFGPGLSPLVRGKRKIIQGVVGVIGSIPACAGETIDAIDTLIFNRVYPRLCGGNHWSKVVAFKRLGLSPLVRGKLSDVFISRTYTGSIPACAGETQLSRRNAHGWRVYPRLCGGNRWRRYPAQSDRGLSPLVRGKRLFFSDS